MKYHILSLNTDESVIGQYPQIEEQLDYDYTSPRSYLNVSWNELADFDPDFRAKFTKGATPTNVVELLSVGYGLCMNSDCMEVFRTFKLSDHRTYPVSIEFRREIKRYHYLHTINSCLPFIDWSATRFEYFRKNRFEILKEIKVGSLKELNDQKRHLTFEYGIKMKQIVLNKEFPNFDFISLWGIFPQFLVSDELLSALISKGMTGFAHRKSDLIVLNS